MKYRIRKQLFGFDTAQVDRDILLQTQRHEQEVQGLQRGSEQEHRLHGIIDGRLKKAEARLSQQLALREQLEAVKTKNESAATVVTRVALDYLNELQRTGAERQKVYQAQAERLTQQINQAISELEQTATHVEKSAYVARAQAAASAVRENAELLPTVAALERLTTVAPAEMQHVADMLTAAVLQAPEVAPVLPTNEDSVAEEQAPEPDKARAVASNGRLVQFPPQPGTFEPAAAIPPVQPANNQPAPPAQVARPMERRMPENGSAVAAWRPGALTVEETEVYATAKPAKPWTLVGTAVEQEAEYPPMVATEPIIVPTPPQSFPAMTATADPTIKAGVTPPPPIQSLADGQVAIGLKMRVSETMHRILLGKVVGRDLVNDAGETLAITGTPITAGLAVRAEEGGLLPDLVMHMTWPEAEE